MSELQDPANSLLTAEEIEANRDKLDLRRELSYVQANLPRFEAGLGTLTKSGGFKENDSFVNGLGLEGFERENDPQISVPEVRTLMRCMPPFLARISSLHRVNWCPKVPMPRFDADGNFDKNAGQEWADPAPDKFPPEGFHPTRVLIGFTTRDGREIWPTPIPRTVSNDVRAVRAYQAYVMAHEFMHSVLNPLILGDREKMLTLIDQNGGKKTFEQWRREFMESIISGGEPLLTSMYAANYEKDLVADPQTEDQKYAMLEQICETFAAYVLNAMPNAHGYGTFMEADFRKPDGSAAAPQEGKDGQFNSKRHRLIQELCWPASYAIG